MKRKKNHGSLHMFIIMALLREGSLSLKDLEEKTVILASHFRLFHEIERAEEGN